jgi:YaiO family outer membrane protein
MKKYRSFFSYRLMLMLILAPQVYADELKSFIYPIRANQTVTVISESPYQKYKKAYFEKKDKTTLNQVILYLKEHPADGDVRLLLGQIYFDKKEYEKARQELLTVLQQTPTYVDASIVLINVEMTLTNYSAALKVANAGLKANPGNKNLLTKRKNIIYSINAKDLKYTAKHKSSAHHTLLATKISKKNDEKKYLNEIGINQQQYYISDVKKVWDYSTLYYGRETSLGKVYGKLNYANRFATQAVQGEIEAYPRINKYIYLDLDFAYANNPLLFPNLVYGAEAYVAVGKTLDFSLGGKYNRIEELHHFTLYTGSLSKRFKSNSVTFRPYYFVPGTGQRSTLYILDFRHMISDPYYYIGCQIGAGNSPDLADLETVGFIVLKNKIISPYIKFPLLQDRLIINISGYYQNQIFPQGRIRNWSGAAASIAWKF